MSTLMKSLRGMHDVEAEGPAGGADDYSDGDEENSGDLSNITTRSVSEDCQGHALFDMDRQARCVCVCCKIKQW